MAILNDQIFYLNLGISSRFLVPTNLSSKRADVTREHVLYEHVLYRVGSATHLCGLTSRMNTPYSRHGE